MSVNKETKKGLKKYKCLSSQETLFRSHRNWIRDKHLHPMMDYIEDRIDFLEKDLSNMKDTTGFNMDGVYQKLMELFIDRMEELEDFYNDIKMKENTEGKTYKLKD